MKKSPDTQSQTDKEAHDVEREVGDILVIVEDLQFQLENSRQINKALQEDLDSARTEHKETVALADDRAEEIVRLQEELASFKAENERLLADLSASDAEQSEAAGEIQRLMQELEESQKTTLMREGEILVLQKAAADSSRASEVRENKIKESGEVQDRLVKGLEENLDKREHELYQANAAIEDLKQQNELLEARIASLERSRAVLDRIHGSVKKVRERVSGAGRKS